MVLIVFVLLTVFAPYHTFVNFTSSNLYKNTCWDFDQNSVEFLTMVPSTHEHIIFFFYLLFVHGIVFVNLISDCSLSAIEIQSFFFYHSCILLPW